MTKFEAPESTVAGFFFNKDERDEFIESGEALTVVAIKEETDTYKGKTRQVYVVTFDVDGQERGWSFGLGSSDGSETSRDRLLAALKDYLTKDDAEVTQVVVGRIGQFQTVEIPEEA